MNSLVLLLSLIILGVSCLVLWKVNRAVEHVKSVMFLVYDWLEELESDSHKCRCEECQKTT